MPYTNSTAVRVFLFATLLTLTLPFAAARADDASSTPDVATTTPNVSLATSTPPVATTTPILPPSVPIHLEIDTATTTLFSDYLTVDACAPDTIGGAETVNLMCAINQTNLPTSWTPSSQYMFLNSISGAANDYAANNYWGWFSNAVYGQTAMNVHPLTSGEDLLVTIGRMPLSISATTLAPQVGDIATITVSHFAFDANYNPIWQPAQNGMVYIAGQSYPTDVNGQVAFTATSTDPLDVYATVDGFLPSKHIALLPTAAPAAPAPIATGDSTGITPAPSTSASTGNASAALAFLLSQQKADGSFTGSFIDDWAALALAQSTAPQAAKNALKTSLAAQQQFDSVTDYERRAMANEALGQDPNAGADPIAHITTSFDGTQIGDKNLTTDDIFALFPLTHAGYTVNDSLIQKEVAHVLSAQSTNGSFDTSVDVTAAAIQALAPLTSIDGVTAALAKARTYLAAREQPNGCFGNDFSTSWAMQAIAALGENPANWAASNGGNPLTCLATYQQQDGGFESTTTDQNTRIWATSYALLALQNKTWNLLLHTFAKQDAPSTGGSSLSITVATSTATTTPPIAATSTTPVLLIATSTPAVVQSTATSTATTTPNRIHTALRRKHEGIIGTSVATVALRPATASTIAPETQVAGVGAATLPAETHGGVRGFFASLWRRILSTFTK